MLPLSNKELLRTWLIKIKRTNTPVSKNSYLCRKHFEEECFIKPHGGQRIRLKPGSVPTKFVFTVQRKERKRPCCRGEAMDTIKRTASKKINFDVTTDDVAEDDQLEFCQPELNQMKIFLLIITNDRKAGKTNLKRRYHVYTTK